MSQARISDPEVIHQARRAVLRFGETVDAGLGGLVAAMHGVRDRLRMEHLPSWKAQSVKRQELYHQAHRLWMEAEDDIRRTSHQGGVGRVGSDDERRAMRKAKARWDEAEEKIAAVKRWLIRLDDEGDALAGQCGNHGMALRDLVTAAANRLDQAAAAVETYQAIALPPGGGGAHG